MIELYHNPISTCSQKVRLCLAEKGLDYVSREINFGKREHLSDAYLAVNQNGVVPTLVHGGQSILDSSVICEYIDEVWPTPPLSPSTAVGRAAMRAWMRYLEEVPTVAIRVPSFNKLFAKGLSQLAGDDFAQMTDKMPLRKAFYRKMEGEKGFNKEIFDDSIEKLESTLVRAEEALTRSRWLVGDNLTIADMVLLPTIVRMEDIGLSAMWQDKPSVTNWFNAYCARAAFDIAFFPGSRINPAIYELGLETKETQ